VLEVFGKHSFVIITSYASSIILIALLIGQTLFGKWQSEKKLNEQKTNNAKSQ
jgi:hypothetical protein